MEKLDETYLIFDLDGTLTDSAEGVIHTAQFMMKKMGMEPWSDEDLRFMVGPPLMNTFRNAFGMHEEEAKKALVIFRSQYFNVGAMENKVYDGIVPMLQALKRKGKCLAVATSKNEAAAQKILKHFGLDIYFDVIGGDTEENDRNCKAKVLAHVIDQLRIKPKEAVMIGDRHHDVEGAHQIGMPCVAVGWGYGTPEEFLECGADFIAKTPADLAGLF